MVVEQAQPVEVAVSRSDVEEYKRLQAIMTNFRKTLGPRKENIYESVVTSVDMSEVCDLIEVSGGESLTITGTVEGKKIGISFRLIAEK